MPIDIYSIHKVKWFFIFRIVQNIRYFRYNSMNVHQSIDIETNTDYMPICRVPDQSIGCGRVLSLYDNI